MTVYRDTIKTENEIFKWNMTSKGRRGREGGGRDGSNMQFWLSDTRCYVNEIFPPEDGHVNARNMSRIIM
jgi:hypothetical protein